MSGGPEGEASTEGMDVPQFLTHSLLCTSFPSECPIFLTIFRRNANGKCFADSQKLLRQIIGTQEWDYRNGNPLLCVIIQNHRLKLVGDTHTWNGHTPTLPLPPTRSQHSGQKETLLSFDTEILLWE